MQVNNTTELVLTEKEVTNIIKEYVSKLGYDLKYIKNISFQIVEEEEDLGMFSEPIKRHIFDGVVVTLRG